MTKAYIAYILDTRFAIRRIGGGFLTATRITGVDFIDTETFWYVFLIKGMYRLS